MLNPLELGIDNNLLFVCDKGLKVYDLSDKHNLEFLNHFNIEANDVIPYQGILLVTGESC